MNLDELINLYSPWNHPETYGFMMVSGGIEIKLIRLNSWLFYAVTIIYTTVEKQMTQLGRQDTLWNIKTF